MDPDTNLRKVEMSSTEISSNGATGTASARSIGSNLEVVVVPVSDVDRAKEFYGAIGWRLAAGRRRRCR
jgi:hypothetical protein